MTITVSSGVGSEGLTISSGDPLVVLSGGYVDGRVRIANRHPIHCVCPDDLQHAVA